MGKVGVRLVNIFNVDRPLTKLLNKTMRELASLSLLSRDVSAKTHYP